MRTLFAAIAVAVAVPAWAQNCPFGTDPDRAEDIGRIMGQYGYTQEQPLQYFDACIRPRIEAQSYAPPPPAYAPPPQTYAPPPVYAPPPGTYAPPPVYYAPPPVYYYPAPVWGGRYRVGWRHR
jgi:hypothetical protein